MNNSPQGQNTQPEPVTWKDWGTTLRKEILDAIDEHMKQYTGRQQTMDSRISKVEKFQAACSGEVQPVVKEIKRIRRWIVGTLISIGLTVIGASVSASLIPKEAYVKFLQSIILSYIGGAP